MKNVRIWLMRVLGVLNILFALIGLYYFGVILRLNGRRGWIGSGSPALRHWIIFSVLCSLTVGLTVYLIYLGAQLLRNENSALRPVCIVFGIEILSVFAMGASWAVLPGNPDLIGGFFSIPGDPFAPQIATGYPIIGLIICLILLLGNKRDAKHTVAKSDRPEPTSL